MKKDTANILHNIIRILVNINIALLHLKWNDINIPVDNIMNNPPTSQGLNIARI